MTSGINLNIIDAETGSALQGVTLYTTEGSADNLQYHSNAQGNINIQDVKTGLYQFSLKRDGYAPVSFTLQLKQGEQLN